jgi:hypothetical protein
MRSHLSAAAALALALVGCGHGSRPPTASLHVVSSVSDRATLAGALQWTAVAAGVQPEDPVARVDFLLDGRRRWSDRQPPFVFNDDDNALHPWLLASGTHRLAVRLVTTHGRTVGTASEVTVAPAPPVPRGLAGRWRRRAATGTWHARFARNGVVFFAGPHGMHGAEAFTALHAGLIALAGPVLWLGPEPHRRRLCHVERPAPYGWHVHAAALTLTTRHDRRCPGRAALFAGTWTRR